MQRRRTRILATVQFTDIVAIDATSDELSVSEGEPLDSSVFAATAGGGSLWLLTKEDALVTRVDADTGSVVETLEVEVGERHQQVRGDDILARDVAWSGRSLWVTSV